MAEGKERAPSDAFRQLSSELLAHGLGFRFQATGKSMLPAIQDGEILHVQPVSKATLKIADIVLFTDGAGFKAHRVLRKKKDIFVVRGDSGMQAGSVIRRDQVVGKIIAKECPETGRLVTLGGLAAQLRLVVNETKKFASNRLRYLKM